jgi:hypothetical protein
MKPHEKAGAQRERTNSTKKRQTDVPVTITESVIKDVVRGLTVETDFREARFWTALVCSRIGNHSRELFQQIPTAGALENLPRIAPADTP